MVKNRVYIRIHDFEFNVDELSRILNIKPTNAWNKGDLIEGRNIPIYRKQSTWELKSELAEKKAISEHIQSLLKMIEPSKDKFIELAQNYKSELSIVMQIEKDTNPGILIEKDILKKIAELQLEMDCDLYFSP